MTTADATPLHVLTGPQTRIWHVEQLHPRTPIHNLAGAALFRGPLDFERLASAFDRFVRLHDAARIRVVPLADGSARQYVAPFAPLSIETRDFSSDRDPHAACRRWLHDQSRIPFELNDSALLRAAFLRVSDDEHGYFVNCHHLIADGWSFPVLSEFVSAAYADPAATIADAPAYLELLHDERHYATSGRLDSDRRFWTEELAGAPSYAIDRSGTGAEQVLLHIPPSHVEPLRQMAFASDVPLGTLFTALLLIHVGARDGTDVVIGLPIANRSGRRRHAFGMFTSTMPLRMRLSGDEPIGAFVQRVQAALRRCYRHQRYPYQQLVRDLGIGGERQDQLFHACMNVYNIDPSRTARINGTDCAIEECFVGHQLFPLYAIVKAWSGDGSVEIALNYKPALYTRADVEQLGRLLVDGALLAARLPAMKVDDIGRVFGSPMSAALRAPRVAVTVDGRAADIKSHVAVDAERALLLRGFNDTTAPFPRDTTVVQLFEHTAGASPNRVALRTETGCWSYAQLNARANQLARVLRDRGVARESVVPVLVDRSPDLVVALLGVHKAGGAYLPIDPSYPAARVQFILEDSQASVVITTRDRALSMVARDGATIVRIDDRTSYARDGSDLAPVAGPEDLAAVCYTSGSTGRPKGVLIEHRGLVNRLHWMQQAYPLDSHDVLIQKTSVSFDVSGWELFWWALAGASVYLPAPGDEKNPTRLVESIETYAVTTIHFVPSMLQAFLAYVEHTGAVARLRSLRRVFASGEPLRPDHVGAFNRLFAATGTRLTNLYGPTEATIDVTAYDCPIDHTPARIPIGKPIANTWLRVLSRDLTLQPIGVAGELYIGGVNLARGYLRQPTLTAQRFVADPFESSERLYRTGDLARWLPDGTIEFLGRNDDQVKIRGHRIELGEVEAALREHNAVRDAVAILRRSRRGDPRLCAYVVLGAPCLIDDIKTDLMARVPAYMVPGWLQAIDAIPLGMNGKIDRAALPEPALADARERPETAEERALAAIWQDVLDELAVGVHDNFFALGGDSIKVISVVARARSHGWSLSTEDVYRHPTVRELATVVGARAGDTPTGAEPAGSLPPADRVKLPAFAEDAYPLSALQIGLIYQSHLIRETPFYHDVFSYRIRGEFDADAFRGAVEVLCRRHAIFRTSFDLDGYSEPMQIVHRSAPAPLSIADLRGMTVEDQDRAIERDVAAIRRKAVDWTVPGLVGFHVHRLTDAEYLYTIDFHDSALDGWSVNVVHRDLFETYHALRSGGHVESSEIHSTYRAFIDVERRALADPATRRFWARTLDGSTVLVLPRWAHDRATPAPGVAFHEIVLPPGLSNAIAHAAKQIGVPVKVVLLAAHLYVLSRLSGERDVVTGYEYGVRPEGPDADRLVGLFLNTLPLRVDVRVRSWRELVEAVQRAEIDLLAHRWYPMAQIKRDQAVRGPLFEAVFNFTHFHVLRDLTRLPGFELTDVQVRAATEFPFRAEWSIHPFTDDLLFWIHYHADAFPAEQIAAIGGYYVRALQLLTRDPSASPSATSLVGDVERHRQLEDFNAHVVELPAGCVHEWIEAQARRTPSTIAVSCGPVSWTFEQLNCAANTLAHAILRTSPRRAVVGVAVPRGLAWMAATIACFKSGSVYLPIDVEYPAGRIAEMLTRSGCRLLVAGSASIARMLTGVARSAGGVEILIADQLIREADDHAVDPALPVAPGDPAYIIFTSGSTGAPKGAMISHAGMMNHLLAKVNALELSASDVVVQNASPCFDVSLWQLLAAPLVGGRTAIVPQETVSDVAAFVRAVQHERATILEVVPSYLSLMLDCFEQPASMLSALRYLVVTGETTSVELLERWFALRGATPVINAYGPTEAGDDICHHRMTVPPSSGRTPVGTPIQNTHVYVVDERFDLVPIGTAGEICVSSIGVGIGYVNDSARTAAAFVPDPFRPFERMYRTGDVGWWSPDGVLELAGRLDDQVKIRGHRIETGDIESGLLRCDGVKQAAVIVDTGRENVVAFVVAPGVDAGALRRDLAERLPEYMVPARVVPVDRLPLSEHGKVAKQELRTWLDRTSSASATAVAPVGTTEIELQQLWASVLKIDPARINRDSDFFEIGGHSLKAMELSLRSRERVSVNDVVKYPVLRDMARRLERAAIDGSGDELLVDYSQPRSGPASVSLVGFTYAGGHAVNFKALFDAVSARLAGVACYAVELPRRSRLDVSATARLCVERIRATIRSPIVVWGHCSGSALALEAARRLEADGADLRLVILGAKVIHSRPIARARRIAARSLSPFMAVDAAGMSIAQIKTWLEEKTGFDGFRGLGDEDSRFLAEAFRHDAVSAGRYFEHAYDLDAPPRIAAPILNVVAKDDPLTTGYEKKHRNWRLFSERVELRVLDGGGHYFTKTRSEETADLILDHLHQIHA